MSTILTAIRQHAGTAPDLSALRSGALQLSYGDLWEAIGAVSRHLTGYRPRVLGLALQNSPAWVVLDLAALNLGIPVVPVPDFFSTTQRAHVLRDAGADWLVCDAPEAYAGLAGAAAAEFCVAGRTLFFLPLAAAPARLPPQTAKITYTSGTTGNPKGVCLSAQAQYTVAASLAAACRLEPGDRHLSLLPLSTLLENIGGVYAPLLAGAGCVLEPLSSLGSVVAGRFDAVAVGAALTRVKASTTILVPQMLEALVDALAAGAPALPGLRFVAVGGARVAPRLLQRTAAIGLPVYEGYGLSECASVVALNTSEAYCAGSVGKPLPHVRLSFGTDGEIFVSGATLTGYVGDGNATPAPEYWPSGDLGYLDAQGFLHLHGRKKNLLITSFGRNISPEWVESELCADPMIAQAVVFGEGRPWPVAVLVPRHPELQDTRAQLTSAVSRTNAELPEYARIGRWLLAEAFTRENGQTTSNGRVCRDQVWQQYQHQIELLYQEDPDHVLS